MILTEDEQMDQFQERAHFRKADAEIRKAWADESADVQSIFADAYGLVIAVYQGAIDDETGENL